MNATTVGIDLAKNAFQVHGVSERGRTRLLEHMKELDRQADEIEDQIIAWHRDSGDSRKVAEVPGIELITARAVLATVGDAKSIENGRQLAAWLGSVWKRSYGEGTRALPHERAATNIQRLPPPCHISTPPTSAAPRHAVNDRSRREAGLRPLGVHSRGSSTSGGFATQPRISARIGSTRTRRPSRRSNEFAGHSFMLPSLRTPD